ncbi:unnamed protein product [Malus baccata var. baccata]
MEGSSAMSNEREGIEIDLSKITLRLLDLVDIDDFMVAICLDNRPIGYILVTAFSGNDRCRVEIGYALGSKYWGKWIAIVKLVADDILKEWTHLERLEAFVDVDNVGSQRVLQKQGALYEVAKHKGRYTPPSP